jgi:hypothetical protein
MGASNRWNVYATAVVLAHAGVVFWHLQVLAKLNPNLSPQKALLFASLASLVPILAVILLWFNLRKLAACLALLFFTIPLAIGGYEHFLSSGPDNIFRMAAGEGTLAFLVSAVLLLMLELLGCWVSIQILREPSLSHTQG